MRVDATSLTRKAPDLVPGQSVPWVLPQVLRRRIQCRSELVFALAVSAFWLVVYNAAFWQRTFEAMWFPSMRAVLFLGSLAILVLTLQAILLLLAPTRRVLRILAGALFIVAAIGSYFASAYGTLLDKDMLRNVMQTDMAEVGGLITPKLLLHVFVLGFLPALLVWRVDLPKISWKARLRQRVVFIVCALAVSFLGMLTASSNYAVFLREHKPIRYALVPVMPVASAARLGVSRWKGARASVALVDTGGPVTRMAAAGGKPLVVFVVVGETARAANFQLGGYARATNPRLSNQESLVYFGKVSSCGTATAVSLPCLFSQFSRSEFDVDKERGHTNALDVLTKGGFDVEWRDNNAGCKGVCARVEHIDYKPSDENRDLCPNGYCYDEIMLKDLADKLGKIDRDTVIVFHQIGSHGPAYSERYPPQFEIFKPACASSSLHSCTQEQIANSYDNTIAYTDYVLSRQIEALRAAQNRLDSLLIYVSDHGESLGEQGIYLHGMPYAIAPRAQKEVPLLIWTSAGYAQRTRLNLECLRNSAQQPRSHDNFYHTLLGAAGVRNSLYDEKLDILKECRR